MSIENRDFDIIVWGASGFTGRLVAEYLFQKYNSKNLKWAIAGRDKSKLTSIRNSHLDSNIPILIADSFDYVSLNSSVQYHLDSLVHQFSFFLSHSRETIH